ncbi:hypothetical protein ACE1OC_04575 [Streptomyces sp. DSM 116496]
MSTRRALVQLWQVWWAVRSLIGARSGECVAHAVKDSALPNITP